MIEQDIAQRCAGSVKPHGERPAGNAEIGRHHRSVLITEIQTLDKLGVCRTQHPDKSRNAGAQLLLEFRRFLGQSFDFTTEGGVQAFAARIPAMIVGQGGAKDSVKPGVHTLHIAQLIFALHDFEAEILQHVLGLGPVAQTSGKEPEKCISPIRERGFGLGVVESRFVLRLSSHLHSSFGPYRQCQ